MYLVGEVGCALLLYAPYLIAATHAARAAPQLLCVWLGTAALSYFPLFFIALFYIDVRDRSNKNDGVSLATCARVIFVLLAVTMQFTARLATQYGWYALHRHLQRVTPTGQALFYSTRWGFLPVSLTIGLGFGFVAMLVNAGTFFDAGRQIIHYTPGSTAYDMYACPMLPSLLHRVLQSVLLTLCHAAWGVMSGQGLIALYLYGVKRYMRLLWVRWSGAELSEEAQLLDNSSSHGSIGTQSDSRNSSRTSRQDDKGNTEENRDEQERQVTPPLPRDGSEGAHFTREELEGNTTEPAATPATEHHESREGRSMIHTLIHTSHTNDEQTRTATSERRCTLLRDTNLTAHIDLALALLVLCFLLQLIFSLLSLLHARPLFTINRRDDESSGYTCAVSLPLQLIVTVLSLLLALCVVQAEQGK